MPTAEHRGQRQLHPRRYRAVSADRGVGQLEQRIRAGIQAAIEPVTKLRQSRQCLDGSLLVQHTHLYGLRAIGVDFGEKTRLREGRTAVRRSTEPTRS